jgi:hypothetical protein
MWIWISTTYFTCALDFNNDGIITKASAICRWTIGKSKDYVKNYYTKKKVILDWKEFDNYGGHLIWK